VSSVTLVFMPKFKDRALLAQKRQSALEKISQAEKEIAELRQREFDFKNNPFYLEKLARNKLGYTKPGEVLYRIDN